MSIQTTFEILYDKLQEEKMEKYFGYGDPMMNAGVMRQQTLVSINNAILAAAQSGFSSYLTEEIELDRDKIKEYYTKLGYTVVECMTERLRIKW